MTWQLRVTLDSVYAIHAIFFLSTRVSQKRDEDTTTTAKSKRNKIPPGLKAYLHVKYRLGQPKPLSYQCVGVQPHFWGERDPAVVADPAFAGCDPHQIRSASCTICSLLLQADHLRCYILLSYSCCCCYNHWSRRQPQDCFNTHAHTHIPTHTHTHTPKC